jgi:hypothetical protein
MLYGGEETGAVDLRLARAYVPICMSSLQLGLMLLFIATVPMAPAYSWLLAAIFVHVQRHVRPEAIFDSSVLLLAVSLASLVHEYRLQHAPAPRLQGTVNLLWVAHFVHVATCMAPWAKRIGAEYATWACHGALLVLSLYTAPAADMWNDMLVRPVIFFVSSVCWLYLVDGGQLSYSHVHDCHSLVLRFSPLLFTPLPVSCFLLLLTVAICVCVSLHWQFPWRESSESKKHDDLSSPNDAEFFRMAMSAMSQGLSESAT